jgi:hypothetical protein
VRSLGWMVNAGVGSCVLATLFVLWPIIMRSRRGDAADLAASRGTAAEG